MRRMVQRLHFGMDMHMGRDMQAAGMGVQQRHQALQQRQYQNQAEICEVISHAGILSANGRQHQSFGCTAKLGKAGQGGLGCGSACGIPRNAPFATDTGLRRTDFIRTISGTPLAQRQSTPV